MSAAKIAIVSAMLAFPGSCGTHISEKNACELETGVRPVKLLASEPSYSQIDNYINLFSDPSFHWIERNAYPDKGGLSVDRFEVKREIMGQSGKLEYVFYFRRLAEMAFHPDNAPDFFQTAKSEGLPASEGARLVVGEVEYRAIRNRERGEYLGVADRRIGLAADACIYAFD